MAELRTSGAEPCPCGSGLTYALCHRAIIESSPADRLAVSRRQYAGAWAVNSTAYDEQGVYDRLACILAGHGRLSSVIDIGCGRGEGMVALRRLLDPNARLVGIDENIECLHAAADRLKTDRPNERMTSTLLGARSYALDYAPGRPVLSAPVALVQSDLLRNDPDLGHALADIGAFDAVTLWFTGTHKAREHDRVVEARSIGSDQLYGVAMELAAFGFAGERLRSGGLLQIVDRAAHPDLETIRHAYDAKMRAIATDQPFALIDLQLFRYVEPATMSRISVGSSARDADPLPKAAISAVFRRD